MTSRSSQEEAPTTTISSHAQPTASADEPPATLTITADRSVSVGEVSYLNFLLKLNKPTGNSTKRCIKIFLVCGYFTSLQVRLFPPLRVFPHLYQFEKVFQLVSLRTYFFLLPENKCLNFVPFCLALSLEGNHEEAIKVREGETLEIYRKHLGDRHPFTATMLNNLSNNYSALGEGREEFKDAKAYLRECKSMQSFFG